MSQPPKLLDRVRDEIRVWHYSCHASVQTTMIYTHVLNSQRGGVRGPLDT